MNYRRANATSRHQLIVKLDVPVREIDRGGVMVIKESTPWGKHIKARGGQRRVRVASVMYPRAPTAGKIRIQFHGIGEGFE